MREIILALQEIGAIKFGEFKLKSGILSPVYIDLRMIISYPKLLQEISSLMWKSIADCKCDLICGVPYTAIPIATAISLSQNVGMVMRRKEIKTHGTGKIIEGVFEKGMKVALVDDLVTSGVSIFETITPLEEVGLCVKDIVVLLDREQGGRAHIEKKGYRLHALFTLRDVLEVLKHESKITAAKVDEIELFLRNNRC